MHTIKLGTSSLTTSRLAYGCWRVAGTWDPAEVTPEGRAEGRRAILAAFEEGYTLFDNAAIYCRGEAERVLGEALREVPEMRRRVAVATKCGIRPAGDPHPDSPARYEFTAAHIIQSCENSLQRLGIETIDLFMLHRPDYLADPSEIAGAFSILKDAGKVQWFGVSNFRPSLLAILKAACPMPLVTHQVEISLAKLSAFDDGTLDQCLGDQITPMAWSPLAAGLIGEGATRLLPSQKAYKVEKFRTVLEAVARARGTSRTNIAIAWLLVHPSKILPIIGSTKPDRIREAAKAADIELSREEWYRLFVAARGEPLP